MISAELLTKRYEKTVVDAVSFEVEEGETLILLGTSGCGKTTLLKMINRLVEPSSGTVRVFGQDVAEQDPEHLRRRIGYVIQHVGLFPHYTVEQNVAIVPHLLSWEKNRVDERVRALLETVGLPADEFESKWPHELSGGQRQRVGLARALAADPPIVLLDEPFGALDPITRRQLQREFLNLKRRLKKTMILVTHDVAEAITLGQRICLLDEGRIQQIGAPAELLFSPANDFVRSFFDPGRFQLELMALRFDDVKGELEAPEPGRAPARRFESSTPLIDVVEEPALLDGAPFAIDFDDGTELVSTHGAVLQAFLRRRRASATA